MSDAGRHSKRHKNQRLMTRKQDEAAETEAVVEETLLYVSRAHTHTHSHMHGVTFPPENRHGGRQM